MNVAMARPRLNTDDIATEERILIAARREFGRVGYGTARLVDIAQAAGITRPSLLYHWNSKDELYAAVVRSAFARLGAMLLESIESDRPFHDRLETALERFIAFMDDEPELARLMVREMLDDAGPGHHLLLELGVPLLDRLERFLRKEGKGILREGVPARAALLQVVSAVLVRASSGSLRDPLWGKTDALPLLTRMLLIRD